MADLVSGSLELRLQAVRERIERACARAGRRSSDVTLVAVSKGQPLPSLERAFELGLRVFGENYVQEMVAKSAGLPSVQWRFIGRLQRNKAKHVASVAHTVETVDSLTLAEELCKRARAQRRSLDILVQINIGSEPQKAGCSVADAPVLVEQIRALCDAEQPPLGGSPQGLKPLTLKGLMAIPPAADDAEASRPYFHSLWELAHRLDLHDVSMGMSHDFEQAIEEGATHIRVGTALFGPRPAP